ncbi:hypothetical protein DOY81_013849, partial [Sarcophaga bullata]
MCLAYLWDSQLQNHLIGYKIYPIALAIFKGLATNKDMMSTAKNTIAFDISIANRNVQFTLPQFNSTNDKNIKEGKANVPNVPRPLVSAFDMILKR